ncbi:MAG: ABC transporter ATP-binding protein, partial [Verrucomicrobiota bacterium]
LAEHPLYLLDEPTNHLDMGQLTALMDHIVHHFRRGSSFLIATQDMNFANAVSQNHLQMGPAKSK